MHGSASLLDSSPALLLASLRMRGGLRKLLLILLVVGVLGTLMYRSRDAINLKGFSWSDLVVAVRQANWWLLLLSLAAIYVCYAIRALRWERFSRYIGRPTFGNIFRCTLIGFSAIFLLGRAGEPVRPLLIARKDHLSVSGTFGIYVLERIFDVGAAVVLLGYSLLKFSALLARGGSDSGVALVRSAGIGMMIGLAGAVAFLVYFRVHGAEFLSRRLAKWREGPAHADWRRRAAGLFEGFSQGLQAIRTLGDLGYALGTSVAHWVLVILVYSWVLQSFHGKLAGLDLSASVLVLAFTLFGSTVQLPAVGGGTQAATFLALTLVFGVEGGPAAAASIVLWLISFAGSLLAGVPLLIHEGWSLGDLSRMAKAETEAEAAGTHISIEADLPGQTGETVR